MLWSASRLPVVIVSAIYLQVADGFTSPHGVISRLKSPSRLFYTNDQPPRPLRQVLTIPVLGPIPGGSPLVVGEDYLLEQPTPMQWKILEEAMHAHRQYLKEERSEATTNNDHAKPVCIGAAPLVAFMDEQTSKYVLPGDKKNSKYATIAAVVGISSITTANRNGNIDSSSRSSFMESIMRVFQPDKDFIRPTESKIRLVGIGRAALSNFFSRLPSVHYEDQEDDDGYIILPHENKRDDYEDDRTPIMMAQFRLLTDSGKRSSGFVDAGRSGNSSPVHALAEMSNLGASITSLHEDRKHLVRGLKAAKARLAMASQWDSLEDHDGLGMLSSGFQVSNNRPSQESGSVVSEASDKQPLWSSPTRNSHSRLLKMENYGMGISSASFSAIPGLTAALAEKLQPYYSPEKQATEEHYYEVFSFMGLLSLSKVVPVTDIEWALKCTNTIERMHWVYQSMWFHIKLLREASEELSQELQDCGEECTDLW